MIFQITITILGWLALMVVGMNLIGMLVRGLVLTSEVKKVIAKGDDAFKKVVAGFYRSSEERRVNVIAIVLIVIYLGVLLYFWNIAVVAVAILIMIARVPDLLWEMRHGGVSSNSGVRADVVSRPNALNGKYHATKNQYGLNIDIGNPTYNSRIGSGLLLRANLADAVIAAAERNGINTLDPKEADVLSEFVIAMTREGKSSLRTFRNMPAIYMLTLLVDFAALPLLWYALYVFPQV